MSAVTSTARPTSRPTVRTVLAHVHDDPAPLWTPGSRGRFAGYLAGSMAAWTVLGVAVTALLGALLDLVACPRGRSRPPRRRARPHRRWGRARAANLTGVTAAPTPARRLVVVPASCRCRPRR
jgi:hypothetical protein